MTLAVFIVLIVLLVLKELVRILAFRHRKAWMRTLDLAIVPLLVAYAVLLAMRFLQL